VYGGGREDRDCHHDRFEHDTKVRLARRAGKQSFLKRRLRKNHHRVNFALRGCSNCYSL
jgi:hypothetical protein